VPAAFPFAIALLAAFAALGLCLARGVATPTGGKVRRRDHPRRFWLHASAFSAFAGFLFYTLATREPRLLTIAQAGFALLLIVQFTASARRALRSRRIAATDRTELPAAYWSAMFGLILCLLLAAAAFIYLVRQALAA
jgi:hypothetical protein